MGYSSDAELTKIIKKSMHGSMISVQKKIYKIIESFMRTYYKEYTPMAYKRTYAFFNSLVKSKICKTPTGFKCSVFIDLDLMDYYYYNTGEEVMDMINQGFHADTRLNGSPLRRPRRPNDYYPDTYETPYNIRGTKVWDESIDEIEKTRLILKTFECFFNKYKL